MRHIPVALLSGALALALPAAAVAQPAADVDALFLSAAVQGNNAEIAQANLVLQRGHADEARGFAQRMLSEHEDLAERLQRAATVRPGRPSVNTVDALALIRLEKLPPADFDQEYLTQQIGDHLATIAVFSAEAENGKNAQLKTFATNALPMLRAHLEQAVDAVRHVGGSSPFKAH